MIIASLDCETLDSYPATAVVFDVGLVKCDVSFPDGIEVSNTSTLELRFDVLEQLANGRTVSPDTIKFHQRIRGTEKFCDDLAGTFESPITPVKIEVGLTAIKNFLEGVDHLWINGLSFDPVVFSSLARSIECSLPWDFRTERDVRTIRTLIPSVDVKSEAKHEALADANWNLDIAIKFHNWLHNLKEAE